MPALHVVVHSPPDQTTPCDSLAPLHGVIDVVVDGVNLTARLGRGEALALLSELCHATAQLASDQHRRSTVQMYGKDEVWEIGLELSERQVLVSVYRPTLPVTVSAFERRVGFAQWLDALEQALNEALGTPALQGQRSETRPAWRTLLEGARGALQGVPRTARAPRRRRLEKRASVRCEGLEVTLVGHYRARSRGSVRGTPQVERSDLHALLCEGTLTLMAGDRSLQTCCHPTLVAEQLGILAEYVLRRGPGPEPPLRRVWLGEVLCEVRGGSAQHKLELRLVSKPEALLPPKSLFARLGMTVFLTLVCDLIDSVVHAVQAADSEQRHNLRLHTLIERARSLREHLEDTGKDDSLTNPTPERYSRYAPPRRSSAATPAARESAMRYALRWLATVPNIELASTFLCGDRLIVGGSRETACLTRHSGAVSWRIATVSAVTTVAPAGLVSIEPSGRVQVHDLATGQQRFVLHVGPPAVGGPAGSVVHCAGLPQLLALAEGDRSVVGIDLLSGQVRWRYRALRPGKFKLRRAGRLLVLSGDDPSLVALDATTGAVVWKLRDRLPSWGSLSFDSDSAFAISGGNGPHWNLHHLDPWTGASRWKRALSERPLGSQPPLIGVSNVVVPGVSRTGGGATAFSRVDGKQLWHRPSLVSGSAAWMTLDGSVVANCRGGELVCLSSDTGEVRFRHAFPHAQEADLPRRLEPVLRNGALFVPQNGVHVVRPADGKILATLPTDLVPDLIRVDERCDVYVAEESGHLAAFGATPQLRLIKA